MGVDGVGVGGRSASDDAGALAVEFFLFGRCRHVSEYCTIITKESRRALPCASRPCLSSSELPCSIVKASEALGQAVEKMAAYDSHLCFQSRVPAEEAYHFFDPVSPVVEVGLEPAAA